MSTLPRDELPATLGQKGAQVLCGVESSLKDKAVATKLKNRHWWERGEKYIRVQFDINVLIGAADLKFQLQSKDKKILSADHNAIRVDWTAHASLTSRENIDMEAYYEDFI